MAVARYLTAVSGLSDVWSVKNVGTVSRQAGGGPANDGIREGVLITGVYGTGKTSVCEEPAERLESAGMAYGAIDLDWLCWFDVPTIDAGAARHTYLNNVAAVANNYVDAGVRLTVPLDEIERRLSGAVTAGRRAGRAQCCAIAR